MQRAKRLKESISVVSFDLDDTFWDCEPAISKAEQVLYEWHKRYTPRITAENDPSSLLEFRVNVRRRNPGLAGCVTSMRLQGLRELLSAYSYPESMAEDAFEIFYKARSEVVLYPHVHELLEKLGKQFSLAAITNGNADLEHIGIAQYFDRLYAADLNLLAKPDKDMFHRCLADFDISGEQLLHIGDNPVTDVMGGIAAGVQTLWFNQHAVPWLHEDAEPHYEAASLLEISGLLAF